MSSGSEDQPRPATASRRRVLGWIALAASIGFVLAMTLRPTPSVPVSAWRSCLLCGESYVAFTLLNVALLAPFGAALGLLGATPVRAAALGLVFALLVEAAQSAVPGRQPELGDLFTNTLGAWLGALAVAGAPRWLWPDPRLARRLATAAALGAVALVALPAALLAPEWPAPPYLTYWTPSFDRQPRYPGRVRSARLDAQSLESGPVASPEALRRRLGSGFRLRLEADAGPAPSELSSLFAVTDADERELLGIAVEHGDVVFWLRRRALAWGFDQPALRAEALLAGVVPGESFALEVETQPGRTCVARGDARRCFEPSVGRGWSFWRGLRWLGEPGRSLLDAVWLAALLVPLGFWSARPRQLVLGGGLVLAALLLVPLHAELRATPLTELLAAAAGLATGAALRRVLSRRRGVAAA